MPIPEQELEHRLFAVDGQTSLADLIAKVQSLKARPRYLVVELGVGRFSALPVDEVSLAVERLGPAVLDLPLSRIPETSQPTGAMERTAMGFGEAQRVRDRQPRRRLVVLENGQPVGLLVNEARGSTISGVPLDLFGPYRTISREDLIRRLGAEQHERTCPYCGKQFTYYELQPETNSYACPHCHHALSAG